MNELIKVKNQNEMKMISFNLLKKIPGDFIAGCCGVTYTVEKQFRQKSVKLCIQRKLELCATVGQLFTANKSD